MSAKPPTSASTLSLFPKANKALRRHIDADLHQIKCCQRGEHQMQSTQTVGVVICVHCRTLGICPLCLSWSALPERACLVPCTTHEHSMYGGEVPQ